MSSWEKTKWRVKGKWHRLILFFFLWSELIFYDLSWSESNFVLFLFFYSIRVDPTRTGGPDFSGAPSVNFRKISVRKTIWDL